MHPPRRHSRVLGGALNANVHSRLRPGSRHAVLDISEGGMRLANLNVPVGSTLTFVVEGSDIRSCGRGHVVRRSTAGTAVAVDEWSEGPEQVRSHVVAGLLAEMTWRDLYMTNWP